jgi:hypothetical protein
VCNLLKRGAHSHPVGPMGYIWGELAHRLTLCALLELHGRKVSAAATKHTFTNSCRMNSNVQQFSHWQKNFRTILSATSLFLKITYCPVSTFSRFYILFLNWPRKLCIENVWLSSVFLYYILLWLLLISCKSDVQVCVLQVKKEKIKNKN